MQDQLRSTKHLMHYIIPEQYALIKFSVVFSHISVYPREAGRITLLRVHRVEPLITVEMSEEFSFYLVPNSARRGTRLEESLD